MTLAELLKDYREKTGLSQRQFALKCGVSNANISMIENNLNPKTGQPITPSLPMLKKIANGMNISLDELLLKTDDFLIDMSQSAQSDLSSEEFDVIELYRQLDREDRAEIRGEMRGMLKCDKYKQDEENVS